MAWFKESKRHSDASKGIKTDGRDEEDWEREIPERNRDGKMIGLPGVDGSEKQKHEWSPCNNFGWVNPQTIIKNKNLVNAYEEKARDYEKNIQPRYQTWYRKKLVELRGM